MRRALVTAALLLVAACGGTGTELRQVPAEQGSAALPVLCPEVHVAIDALVVSRPEAQREFATQLRRILAAGTDDSRRALEPLLEAALVLEHAGTGPDYLTAVRGIHPAVVTADDACVQAGSPILHDGHRSGAGESGGGEPGEGLGQDLP